MSRRWGECSTCWLVIIWHALLPHASCFLFWHFLYYSVRVSCWSLHMVHLSYRTCSRARSLAYLARRPPSLSNLRWKRTSTATEQKRRACNHMEACELYKPSAWPTSEDSKGWCILIFIWLSLECRRVAVWAVGNTLMRRHSVHTLSSGNDQVRRIIYIHILHGVAYLQFEFRRESWAESRSRWATQMPFHNPQCLPKYEDVG